MSKKQEDKKSQSGRVGHGGSTPIHPVSGKDQRLPADHGAPMSGDGIHSGVAIPEASTVVEVVPTNPAALEEGLKNSLGESASGTHKGLPSATHPAVRSHAANPKGSKYHEKTGRCSGTRRGAVERGLSSGEQVRSFRKPGATGALHFDARLNHSAFTSALLRSKYARPGPHEGLSSDSLVLSPEVP